MVYIVSWLAASAVGLHPGYPGGVQSISEHGLALGTALAVSVVNPIYEETFLSGYIITIGKESGHVTAAVNVSVAIRLLCHLYQGSIGVLTIIPVGLVFAVWYVRTARLWPIVAHALFDAIATLNYVG